MKTYTFLAWCRFGKGDSGETSVDVDLTEEESEKLIEYGTKVDVFYDGFYNCTELRELYSKVYAVAVEQITEELRDFGDFDEAKDPKWKADDTYACGIDFPSVLEGMLKE